VSRSKEFYETCLGPDFWADALFPQCVLPGCKNPVEQVGRPCADCARAFGGDSLIQLRVGQPMTAEKIAERDEGIKAAYAAMREVRIADGLEAKRNQICWLCHERRTCTKVPFGFGTELRWECAECRKIT
jgi:hypothetical protein